MHEVEVEQLHQLHLDGLSGAARLEEGGHGKETVDRLERPRVGWSIQECGDKHEERPRLDRRAFTTVEEVEEELQSC